MKRFCALMLVLGLSLGLAMPSLAADADTVEQTVRALGIMVGDQNGNMNLSAPVTRAQFAKMMVAASAFKDSVGAGAGVSPFSDVKHTHWAAEYIKTAVAAGWLTGYVDGSFKPEGVILTEEGAAALLRMLGYTAADLVGTWPTAQMAKYQALGLHEGVQSGQGQQMSRRDCMYLFYNLMGTQTKAGMIYGQTLGYAITVTGEIDYASLVSAGLKGPYVADGSPLSGLVPFGLDSAQVYRAGSLGSPSALEANDVVYYNENLRTVWIYTEKAVGLYSAALPNADSPSQVVVGGGTYSVGTTAAAYKLSTMGPYRVGDTITLLLGRNGEVVEVLDGSAGSGVWHGVLTAKKESGYTGSGGKYQSLDVLEITCTDGRKREFSQEAGSFSVGTVVTVTVDKGETAIRRASYKSVSGTVNSAGTKLGDTPLAAGVSILDSTRDGSAMPVYISRLAGRKLASSDIRLCVLNSAGEIEHLILNDATGDTGLYGVITSVQETGADLGDYGSIQVGIYQYVVHGQSGTYTSDTHRGFEEGPAAFTMSGTSLDKAAPLEKHSVTETAADYLMAGSRKLELAAGVQVYTVENGTYTLGDLAVVSSLDKYRLTAYTDSGHALGGQARVILAEKK